MKNKKLRKISVLDRTKEVLKVEANGILELINRVDKKISEAVEVLYRCKGRVVITGIGKPGLIGRKISATFASTGTPSLFLHPVEAAHGDLGMVVKEDVVIAISNSGETEELLRLVPVIKKIGAKLIVLTGNPESSLSRFSDLCIDISVRKEACNFGLIPTASTTAALALGDALAVVLLEKRGFNLKDYAFYHPGGAIGKKLLGVKDLMRTGSKHAVVNETMLVKDVLIVITKARAGSATVINKFGSVCGIFTDGDLRRSLERDPMITTKPVKKFITKSPVVIGLDMLAVEALRIIKDKGIDELLVVDSRQRPLGVVDEKDLLGLA